MKHPFVYLCLVLFSSSAFFSSCRPDNNTGISTLSNVMLVHASPNTPDVDLYLNDVLQNGNGFAYGDASTYVQSFTGLINIRLNERGTANVLVDKGVEFNQNGNYSIFVIDTLPDVKTMVLEDDLSEPQLGKAKVRFIHLSPDAPAVDVLNLLDSSVVVSNMSFKSYTAFLPLNAGVYDLGIRVVGDSSIIPLPSLTLSAGKVYTAMAKGLLNNNMFSTAFGVQIIQHTP